jgi:hypothetical protein
MYFIPVYFSIELHFNKLLVVWTLFSLVRTSGTVFSCARKTPLSFSYCRARALSLSLSLSLSYTVDCCMLLFCRQQAMSFGKQRENRLNNKLLDVSTLTLHFGTVDRAPSTCCARGRGRNCTSQLKTAHIFMMTMPPLLLPLYPLLLDSSHCGAGTR